MNSSPQSNARRYVQEAIAQAPRLLSALDREPHSASYGSFDRDHWGWKFRDFPLGMLQTGALPVALLWKHRLEQNPYFEKSRVLEWLCASLDRTISRQHANGAFDAFAPNEQDPGTTLGVGMSLSGAARILGDALPQRLRQRLLVAVRRACDFALRRHENHAFISNHWAAFAIAFLEASELLADEKYRKKAEEAITIILSEQSDEGWYREYDGADPGYESLGIFYLAMYWRGTRDTRVLASLRRCIEFYSYCVHPDGSAGGVYGSRHTSLYSPGGFEILAQEIPLAAGIAQFMLERLGRQNVVTPAVSDIENLPSLAHSYLEAALAAGPRPADLPALPCEVHRGLRNFDRSGITVAGSANYYAIINTRKGGVCRIFSKPGGQLAYEDAGYVLTAAGGRWNSQTLGMSSAVPGSSADEVKCLARFAEWRQEMPTPLRFVILRVLNLTVFRSLALGNWLRRQIVTRLILQRRPQAVELERSFRFEDAQVAVSDKVAARGAIRVTQVELPRSFTAIHMGSAKYFHPSELQPLPQPDVSAMTAELNRTGVAQRSWALQWDGRGDCRFVDGIQKQKSKEVEIGAPR